MQLIIVSGCLVIALIFMGMKVIRTLARKGPPACESCPNEKKCASNQGVGQPPCAFEELRPRK